MKTAEDTIRGLEATINDMRRELLNAGKRTDKLRDERDTARLKVRELLASAGPAGPRCPKCGSKVTWWITAKDQMPVVRCQSEACDEIVRIKDLADFAQFFAPSPATEGQPPKRDYPKPEAGPFWHELSALLEKHKALQLYEPLVEAIFRQFFPVPAPESVAPQQDRVAHAEAWLESKGMFFGGERWYYSSEEPIGQGLPGVLAHYLECFSAVPVPGVALEEVARELVKWQMETGKFLTDGKGNKAPIIPENVILAILRRVPGAGEPQQTRFAEFDDAEHPCNKWWQEHGQYMMSGGGRREFIWACRGLIAREQLAEGVEVTGDSLHESKPPAEEGEKP